MSTNTLKDKLRLSLTDDFVDALDNLCNKHNTSFDNLMNVIYGEVQHMHDKEDVKTWLTEYSDYAHLANNKGFVNHFALEYRFNYDADISIWDNIYRTFENIKTQSFDDFCAKLNLEFEEE